MVAFDLLVIGGGINGVGVARDAAGRGLSVCLCEKDDFASHTSSWSTKLIHGGLRYLEHREFRLVRESLIEREILLNVAPHLIRPLRFVLPHDNGMRPAWLLRLGLFIYDHIGGRKLLPPTRSVDLKHDPTGAPLDDRFSRAFEYTDCQVDDSRLVIANAIDARERGAELKPRTRFVSAERQADKWVATLAYANGQHEQVSACALVNAAGPWVSEVLDNVCDVQAKKKLRLVKGSHIVTKPLFEHDRAYIFQNADGRIVFAIPYVNETTLIGTTDVPYEGEPANAAISDEEIGYLCSSISGYLSRPVTPEMVVSTYSGVRPLYDDLSTADASAVTRDYAFDVDAEFGAPLLSVYGGKLTTYRRLAEHAIDRLKVHFPAVGPAWTRNAPLPGGEMGYPAWTTWRDQTRARFAFLDETVFDRMARAYGQRIERVLEGVKSAEDMGRSLGRGLTECEVRYLVQNEFVRTGEDLLFRRTKLGSLMSEGERRAVDALVADLTCNDAHPVTHVQA